MSKFRALYKDGLLLVLDDKGAIVAWWVCPRDKAKLAKELNSLPQGPVPHPRGLPR